MAQAGKEAEEYTTQGSIIIPDLGPRRFSWRKLWAFTGPGFLMSIAYLDPGNFESDVQAGALGGYQLLWVLWWSTVIGLLLQLLAARLGVVTGKNLAEQCREIYPYWIAKLLWIMTELAIIGSDIQEVVGSAIAIQILSRGKIPLFVGVLITALDTFTFLLLEKYGVRKLEALFAGLIAIMAVSFGVDYAITSPNQVAVLKGVVVPSLSKNTVMPAIGILGAIIMPHNIYLHSALVQSRKVDQQNKHAVKEANMYYAIEASAALLISFVINLFVVCVFAGLKGSANAADIGLKTAGEYLENTYGTFAHYMWAIGLLAAGQSSTMTGTYSGQFVMEGFLQLKIPKWRRLMVTRGLAIVPAVIVAITAQARLDELDQWLNILQSVQLPFALLPVLYATSCASLMGYFVLSKVERGLMSFIGVVVISVNIYFIIEFVIGLNSVAAFVLLAIFGAGYLVFIIYLCKQIAHTFVEQPAAAEERAGLINKSIQNENFA